MSIFKGKNLTVDISGTSHSAFMETKVYGIKADFDKEQLSRFLERRKASASVFSTSRIEEDLPEFNFSENGDFSFKIYNKNTVKGDYSELFGKPRPSHADYAWYLKDGEMDFSGGGRFSGRLTAPLCVVGGICKQILEKYGIVIKAYISKTGSVRGKSYKTDKINVSDATESGFPALSNADLMLKEVENAKADGDSIGGIIECIVFGMKKGVGDNLFSGLEGKISSLIYSVPAVKGVEFGLGFDLCEKRGSVFNDQLQYVGDKVEFLSNNAGGINGGISNGNDITLSVAVKPTPSIMKEQKTVDLVNKTNTTIKIKGRHDACILPRAVPCIESAVAIAIYDELGDTL